MIVLLRGVMADQQRNRPLLALNNVPVEYGHKPAPLLHRQQRLASARQALLQRAAIGQRLIEVIHERRAEIVLQREGHRHHRRHLRHYQRRRQRSINGVAPPLLARVPSGDGRRFAGGENCQPHVAAQEEVA